METDERIEKQEIRIRSLQVAVRILAIGLVVWFGISAYRNLIPAPRFEKIFEDMLGSSDKLPGLTLLVLNNYGLLSAIALLLTAVGVVSAAMIPRTAPLWICGSTLLVLVGLRTITEGAMYLPFLKIIQEMTG